MAVFIWLALGVMWLIAAVVWVGGGRQWPLARLWWLAWLGAFVAWLLGLAAVPWRGATVWHGLAARGASWPAGVWRLDERTWPLALVGVTTVWVALLVEAARGASRREDTAGWGGLLWMGGLAPLVALGASPVALVMGWALADVTALLADVLRFRRPRHREAAIWAFFWRAVTWPVALAAVLPAGGSGGLRPVWWLAVVMRLAVAAAVQPSFVAGDKPRWRLVLGLENLLATLGAVTWAAKNISSPLTGGALAAVALLALWGAWRWVGAISPLRALASCGLALGGLAVLAAGQGMERAALAWVFLALAVPVGLAWTPHRRKTLWPFLLAWVLPLGLWPFTPGSAALTLWRHPRTLWGGLAAAAWVMSVGAVAYQSKRLPLPANQPSREGRAFCLLGMAVWAATLWGGRLWPALRPTGGMGTWAWGAGAAVMALGALGMIIATRVQRPPSRWRVLLARQTTSLGERLFWGTYRLIARLLNTFSLLLEGESGVLWALVLLVMLAALLQQ